MKIKEIYELIDNLAPFCSKEEWDNSGLLIGDLKDSVEKIYIGLDATLEVVKSMDNNSLLITHHPLIFKGLKRLDNLYPSNIINLMIKKDIKLLSAHTNFDKAILNEFVAREILGFKILKKDDYLIKLEINLEFDKLIKHLKDVLQISTIRFVKRIDFIDQAEICVGSGFEFIKNVSTNCLISGDLKYHSALEGYENNISLIDINHFDSEKFFSQALSKFLKNISIPVIITNPINPITTN